MFCFPNRGRRGTWHFVFLRTYAREQDKIWKTQFSRVLSHDLYWENKTYKLKRSVREVKHHVTYNVKRKFVPRDQVSPLQYTCRYCSLFQHINQSSFTQCFIHNNCFELFYFAHFLFFNLNLTFAVYVKLRNSLNTQKKKGSSLQTLHCDIWGYYHQASPAR